MKHIVIIGGGAGGLELARSLGVKLGKKEKAKITLIDKANMHVWKPLLHEVASGTLDVSTEGVAYQDHAWQNHYHFLRGEVNGIDTLNKKIKLKAMPDEKGNEILPQRELRYDMLVLALGSVSNDFNTPGVKQHCLFLDSTSQAEHFRIALLRRFIKIEQSHIDADDNEQQVGDDQLKIAIVGGGATGVELAAELTHVEHMLKSYGLSRLDKTKFSIEIIEASNRILGALSEKISDYAKDSLTKLGVKISTGVKIEKATEQGFVSSDGNLIEADMMIWAAGIKGAAFLADIEGLSVNRINQVECERTLKAKGKDDIYVIGDCCGVLMADGKPVPPRAQSAHQMASHTAKNIVNELNGKSLSDYVYKDRGSLVNLSVYSTTGSLLTGSSNKSLFVQGWFARIAYHALKKLHILAVYGYGKGSLIIIMDKLNRKLRPRLKLH